MTATDVTTAATVDETDDRPGTPDETLTAGLALLVLWMLSVLGFAGTAVAALTELPAVALGVTALVWLGPGLLAAPLMLYDGWTLRGTPAADGFRFDPFWTAVVMLLVYPLGLPVYLLTRLQGSYIATMGVDTDEMGFGDEFEFGVGDLLNPTADGVPSVWPAGLVLFAWFAVLMGDGAFAVAALHGGTGNLVVGVVVALGARLVATPCLLFDVYVVSKTGHFTREEAIGLAVVTAILFPLVAVGYLTYRLHRTYR